MAYTPKEWVCGETITAEDLNHMEQGIADCGGGGTDSPIVIKPLEQVGDWDFRVDKTFSEIAEYIKSGRLDIVIASDANVAGSEVYHLSTVNYTGSEVARIQFTRIICNSANSVNVSTLTALTSSGDVFTGAQCTLAP